MPDVKSEPDRLAERDARKAAAIERKRAEQAPAATQPEGGSKMSLAEWGLIFFFAVGVDVGQWLLDNVAVVGLFFNWLIDICMGAFLAFWFWYRGVKPTMAKFLFQLMMTGVETAGDGELPFWWLDVFVMFCFDLTDERIAKIAKYAPMAEKAAKYARKAKDKIDSI